MTMLRLVSPTSRSNLWVLPVLVFFATLVAPPGCTKLSAQNPTPGGTELVRVLNEKLSAAKEASQAGDFDTAINILDEALKIDGSRDLIWSKLAEAYSLSAAKQSDPAERTKRFASAIADYQKAIEIKRNAVENKTAKRPEDDKLLAAYYNNLALAYGRSGNTEGARNACVQAAQLDPDNTGKYYFNLGAILANSDADGAALKAFEMVPANSPEFDKAHEQIEILHDSPAVRSIGPKIQSPAFRSAISTCIQSAKNQFKNLKGKELAHLDNSSQSESTLTLPGAIACNVIAAHEPMLVCAFARSHSKDQLGPDFKQLVSSVRAAVPTTWTSRELDPDRDAGVANAQARFNTGDFSAYTFSGPNIEISVIVDGSQTFYQLKLSVVAYPQGRAEPK